MDGGNHSLPEPTRRYFTTGQYIYNNCNILQHHAYIEGDMDAMTEQQPRTPVQPSKYYHAPSPKVNEAMAHRDYLISSHK